QTAGGPVEVAAAAVGRVGPDDSVSGGQRALVVDAGAVGGLVGFDPAAGEGERGVDQVKDGAADAGAILRPESPGAGVGGKGRASDGDGPAVKDGPAEAPAAAAAAAVAAIAAPAADARVAGAADGAGTAAEAARAAGTA